MRAAYCRTVAESMGIVGQVLHVGGDMLRDDDATGLSLATRMGARLGLGAYDLLDAGNAYAAAALVRQLVEVEYLLWTFADDAEDAGRWLRASRTQRKRLFKPEVMRERSGGLFRSSEYGSHCRCGGHPDPAGTWLLADTTSPVDAVRASWADLGQHLLERAWALLLDGCDAVGYGDALGEQPAVVERFRHAWHERDPAAPRLDGLPEG